MRGALRGTQDQCAATVGDQATIAHRQRAAEHPCAEDFLNGQRLFLPCLGVQQGPAPCGHRDLCELFPSGSELVHVPRGGQCIGAPGVDGAVRRFVGVGIGRCDIRAPHASLRAAVRDQRNIAQTRRNGRLCVGDHRHEARTTDVGAIVVARLEAKVFTQRQRRHPALRCRGEDAVDIAELQSAICQRTLRCLGHEVQRGHARRDFSDVGLGDTDNRAASSSHGVGHALVSGSNTG
ncbi:hypothetical protein D3C86_1306060 [compost metagenome]